MLDFSGTVGDFSALFDLPDVEGIVTGNSLNSLTSIVESELSKWNGKKETDPQMYSTLQKYWNNVNYKNWTPTSVPWSAAFISWVVGKADPSFPKHSAHFYYAKAAEKGQGGWSAWKTAGAKIEAQVGDILVRSRSGGGATASHGDVVYKIENGVAFLAGGNLGDTAKIAAQLSVNSDGTYASFSRYNVVLKKNGSVKPKAVA